MVVGLGASAGGVQAFKSFFEHVPSDSGLVYVAVLHLSPDHESHLAEVLQVAASIPVSTVTGRVTVEPNHVYVVSPRQSLAMDDGYLVQTATMRAEERRAPVDMFFRTLAESHGERAVGIVLSGTGADGSLGLKRVKELGGLCLVQDPREAEHGDMPRHALATAVADAALPVADMPVRIMAYRDSRRSIALPAEPPATPGLDERALADLFAHLRLRTGHDFSNYKRATVVRRIERRMAVRQVTDTARYAALVRESQEEAHALLNDLLISVTNFFRDADAFTTVEREVIPRLFAGKGQEDQVRVWVAGCATGEEAYSLGMLLSEYAAGVPESPSVQIFATDLDERAIAVAREGLYTPNDAADVSADRLRRFFVREGDRYRVRKELRELVLFARHNLVKDPPFSHLDLISCRNLLIYLNRTAQQRVLEVAHFGLNPGGFLFLGSSESVDGSNELFVTFNRDAHVFQSRGVAQKIVPVAVFAGLSGFEARRTLLPAQEPRARERVGVLDLHQRLLEEYAPPSVLVNEDYDIVHLSDTAGRFLQFSGGEPSNNLLKAIRPELRLELRTALYQAGQNRTSVETHPLAVNVGERVAGVTLVVRPVLGEDDPARGYFLVLFAEGQDVGGTTTQSVVPTGAAEPIRQLEDEAARLKAQLRATVEQYETQAEELRASNEELQAINEELRSATEELETSKEELQSLNEELRTVNQELKIKVEEQTQASNDIHNLINSADFGTVFLDRGGRIKLFTPRARDIFSLIPTDRGRPLADINSHLLDVDLYADMERVLDRLERVEKEVVARDGRWHLMRIAPYRTADDRIEGVVLSFIDITERKRADEQLKASEERLRHALEVDTVGVLFFEMDGTVTDANEAFLRMSGYAGEHLRDGRLRWDVLTTREWQPRFQKALEEIRQTGRTLPYEAEYVRPDGTRWAALLAPTRLSDAEAVTFVVDITERRRAEDALREADHRKNRFLATLAHELRNPLGPLAAAVQVLRGTSRGGRADEQAHAIIDRQLDALARLADDLLEVSRVTLGDVELRTERVDLRSVLEDAVASCRPQFDAARHDVALRLPDDALPVRGDAVRLGQVFRNLLQNASTYTQEGGRISVTATRAGQEVCVSCCDNGRGIPADVLPHVFDMFAKGVGPSSVLTDGGLGVGLTLVRELVTAHGGRVEARSDGPGTGSEFLVCLPLAE